jgi:hypothetical protein
LTRRAGIATIAGAFTRLIFAGRFLSQYPQPPFPFPPQPAGPPSAHGSLHRLLAPARLASILQLVFGGLLICMTTCAGSVLLVLPPQEIEKQMKMQDPSMQLNGPLSAILQMEVIVGMGVGLLMIGLAIWLRWGSRAAVGFSLVLQGVIGLALLRGILNAIEIFSANAMVGSLAVLITGSVAALCGAIIAKLIEALRAAPEVAALRAMQGNAPPGVGSPGMEMMGFGYPPPPPPGSVPVGMPQPPMPPAPPPPSSDLPKPP